MSVYDEILEKKKQDRIRYELEQRKEEIKELDKEIDRRRSINYDLSLQIIDKDKEIERLNNINKDLLNRQNEALSYIGNHLSLDSRYKLGNGDNELKIVRNILNKHKENTNG